MLMPCRADTRVATGQSHLFSIPALSGIFRGTFGHAMVHRWPEKNQNWSVADPGHLVGGGDFLGG